MRLKTTQVSDVIRTIIVILTKKTATLSGPSKKSLALTMMMMMIINKSKGSKSKNNQITSNHPTMTVLKLTVKVNNLILIS